MRLWIIPLLWMLQGGCVTKPVDFSIPAAQAGDRTLIVNACGAVSRGGVVCLVQEGQAIESAMQFVVPNGDGVSDGELSVWYMDSAPKNYAITSPIVTINLRDFFNQPKWTTDLSGEITVVGRARYTDGQGIEKEIKMLGFVRIFVLSEGYAGTLPIDSGYVAWERNMRCVVQVTSSGRSAVRCKPD